MSQWIWFAISSIGSLVFGLFSGWKLATWLNLRASIAAQKKSNQDLRDFVKKTGEIENGLQKKISENSDVVLLPDDVGMRLSSYDDKNT